MALLHGFNVVEFSWLITLPPRGTIEIILLLLVRLKFPMGGLKNE